MDTITSLISLLPTIDLTPSNIAFTLLGILGGIIVVSVMLGCVIAPHVPKENKIRKWG